MNQFATLTLLTLLVGGSSACVLRVGDRSSGEGYSFDSEPEVERKSPGKVAFDNRKNLGDLVPGMSVAEVLGIMEEGRWGDYSGTDLTNPHRRESFPMDTGGQAEILYFYTETRRGDGLVREDELTPVYFESGQLVGWGPFGFEAWRTRVLGM